MGLGQYHSLGEYRGPHTVSSLFHILISLVVETLIEFAINIMANIAYLDSFVISSVQHMLVSNNRYILL